MRLTVAGLRRVVKRELPIRFTSEQLTSYGGLELLRRYFERLELSRHVQCALQPLNLAITAALGW